MENRAIDNDDINAVIVGTSHDNLIQLLKS